MKRYALFFFVGCVLILNSRVKGENLILIGYVNYSKIINEMMEVDGISKKLQEIKMSYILRVRNEENELKRLQFQLETLTNENQRITIQNQINSMKLKITEYKKLANEDYKTNKSTLIKSISEELDAAINKIAELYGLSIIFGDKSDIRYCNPEYDYTDKVIEYINKYRDEPKKIFYTPVQSEQEADR